MKSKTLKKTLGLVFAMFVGVMLSMYYNHTKEDSTASLISVEQEKKVVYQPSEPYDLICAVTVSNQLATIYILNASLAFYEKGTIKVFKKDKSKVDTFVLKTSGDVISTQYETINIYESSQCKVKPHKSDNTKIIPLSKLKGVFI